jgi:hypothetical protein
MLINLTTTRGVNLVNIILMVVSCVVAFFIPFELFLFSYAVLGPLHYLTEISWLHKSNYYTKGKYDFLWLILFGIITTVSSIFEAYRDWSDWGANVIFIGFVLSLLFILIKDNYIKILAIVILAFTAVLFQESNFYRLFFTVFLPTLIHVFIFTFIFLLYGAMKSKSTSGYASAVVMILCSLACFFVLPGYNGHQVSAYVFNSYLDFSSVNYEFIRLFHLKELVAFDKEAIGVIFNSSAGIIVMRFIAFAYTYHYLNWFSKTSIIKWHNVPKTRLVVVAILWLASLGFYAYNYNLGLKVLFLLSFMHVYLEFPLNFQSFLGVGKVMGGWFGFGGNSGGGTGKLKPAGVKK